MIRYSILPLLFLVSSMTPQLIGMLPAEEKKEIGEGIARKIAELPKELRYDIFSSALALRENPKYAVYRKFNVNSEVSGIALNADNTRALTGSVDGVARLWDVENGTVIIELKGHTQAISSVALSDDGTLALTGSSDGTARVWNENTGELLKILQVGSYVNSVALSADGSAALIGSDDRIGRLYNTSTGKLLKELPVGSCVNSVALSADGALALTGSRDGKARIWDMNTVKLLKALRVGSWVTSVALSADGALALAGTGQSKVLVWDPKKRAFSNTLLSNKPDIYSIALSKNGKRALVGTHDQKIQVWNTKPLPGQKETSTPLTVLEGHTGSVTAVAFGSADFIASGSDDKTVLIWKPFALEPRGPQEHEEILRQAYKETFSRPKFLFPAEK